MIDSDRELIAAAHRAPSSHNTQPWRFALRPGCIELLADRTRALPVNDPCDRELTISCGAALLNLRVAAAAQGRAVAVTLRPEPAVPDLLARVELGEGAVDEELAGLAPAIARRHTTRGPLAERELAEALLGRLAEAVTQEGARLIPAEDELRGDLAAMVAAGDRAQFGDPSWRRELAGWMHPRRRGEGLVMGPLVTPISRLVVRHFDLGATVGRGDEGLALRAPVLAVLTTEGDDELHWLAAGQALERALLIAAGEGVQAGYLNQPCQVAALREELRARLGGRGHPQLIVRLGRVAERLRSSPRRPVAELITEKL